ncbi:MAG: hypothetical protein L2C94_006860 [Aigarchaeota archaeon]|nr:hypothetical protein [Candidatus Wolframiiraptor gerlachensis]
MRSSVLAFLEKSGVQIPEKNVLKSLLKLSYLTEPQLEVLLIELGSANLGRKVTIREKARIRGVSKGAYARTMRQAIDNIKRSIYTLFLLRYLGVLGDEAVSAIIEAADLLKKGMVEEAANLISSVTPRDITQ